MRTDITVEKIIKEGDVKLNKSELARLYKCDYRTVKKHDEGYEGIVKEFISHLK